MKNTTKKQTEATAIRPTRLPHPHLLIPSAASWFMPSVTASSSMSTVGSTSMQYRLSKPFTRVGSLVNFCPNASLWSGVVFDDVLFFRWWQTKR